MIFFVFVPFDRQHCSGVVRDFRIASQEFGNGGIDEARTEKRDEKHHKESCRISEQRGYQHNDTGSDEYHAEDIEYSGDPGDFSRDPRMAAKSQSSAPKDISPQGLRELHIGPALYSSWSQAPEMFWEEAEVESPQSSQCPAAQKAKCGQMFFHQY